MPRGTRLDAPGSIHHIMIRGIDKQEIFRCDDDRQAFLSRLTWIAAETGLEVLAWALMWNHVHMLARTGPRPLSESMQRLGSGYARYFNRRHDRCGHVFQGRYKSVLIDEDLYLNTVIRYVHRNPLDAGIVRSLEDLSRYPWTGHAALMGRRSIACQAVEPVLALFSEHAADARLRLVEWMAEPDHGVTDAESLLSHGVPPIGHGLVAGSPIHRDAAVAGSNHYVETSLRDQPPRCAPRVSARRRRWHLDRLIGYVCDEIGADVSRVKQGRRGRVECDARAVIAHLGSHELGISFVSMAPRMGVSNSALGQAAERGSKIVREARIKLE